MSFLSKTAAAVIAAGLFPVLSSFAIEPQPTDARFFQEAAQNSIFEIQAGGLAELRSPSDQVKQYGARMVSDYSTLLDQLKSIAAKNDFALPNDMGAKNQTIYDLLTEISGPPSLSQPAFDQVYISEMIGTHQTDIAALHQETASGLNLDLRNWAANALPILREHLRLAQDAEVYLGSVSQVFKKNDTSAQW